VKNLQIKSGISTIEQITNNELQKMGDQNTTMVVQISQENINRAAPNTTNEQKEQSLFTNSTMRELQVNSEDRSSHGNRGLLLNSSSKNLS